ncbi:MAG: type IV secretion system DNA-binding domain-containing protein [Bacteroidales bacterium]|nr:type IV secretion system DNA-binding domain-containing protein [Bacteroidales bacterium]
MPLCVETEGIAAIGRPGSGKSAIIEGLAAQALARGDRVFLLDAKGSLARRLRRFQPHVLALRGANTAVWDVGADIVTYLDALEYATVMIPESHEPVWSSSSRLVQAAMIRHCQARYGRAWGWGHLNRMLSLPIPQLEKIVQRRMPEVATLLKSSGEEPSNAVLSVVLNLVAHVGGLVQTLARAERRTKRRLSLAAWARGDGSRAPIILPLDIRYHDQSAALAQLVVRLLRANLLDPDVSPGVDHRVWIFLDELPRIGKDAIGPVQDLASLGRDRGIRTVMTCQSPKQLDDLLGEAGSAALRENFGLQIICRSAGAKTRTPSPKGGSASAPCAGRIGRTARRASGRQRKFRPCRRKLSPAISACISISGDAPSFAPLCSASRIFLYLNGT